MSIFNCVNARTNLDDLDWVGTVRRREAGDEALATQLHDFFRGALGDLLHDCVRVSDSSALMTQEVEVLINRQMGKYRKRSKTRDQKRGVNRRGRARGSAKGSTRSSEYKLSCRSPHLRLGQHARHLRQADPLTHT
jgi:hypothetical protein